MSVMNKDTQAELEARLAAVEAEVARLREQREVNRVTAMDEATGVPAFWAEHQGLFTWDLLPLKMLHEMYEAWCIECGIVPVSRSRATIALQRAVLTTPGWDFSDTRHKLRAASRCATYEPLLARYGLTGWDEVDSRSFYRGPRRPATVG